MKSEIRLFASTKYLKNFGALVFLSIVLTILFYYSLPETVYPEFTINSVRRCVKFTIAVGWTTLFLVLLAYFPAFIRIPVLFLFFLPSAFIVYLAFVFSLRLDYGCVANLAETNPTELLSFIDPVAVLAILLYVAALSLLGWGIGRLRCPVPHKCCFLLVTVGILVGSTRVDAIRFAVSPVLHMNYLVENLSLYYQNDASILKELVKIEDAEIKACDFVNDRKSSPIVFLHIGESVRADHASFNGYARETMPCVRREFEAGNVVSFPRCVSFSTSTRLCVLGILTPATVLDPIIRHGSFIPYLNAYGVETLGFFSSMPENGSYYDSALIKITRKLRERIFSAGYSDTLHETVASRVAGLEGNAFLLYYGEGAHVPGTAYNREKYAVFTPDATTFEENERRINAYDNCLIATDAFIGNAIDALRDKNAIYIYVSDHGEMLGEDDYWSRNAECYRRKELRHVLAFVWASERFQKTNPDLWRRLKANHERLAVISHDFYYHSILSLFNVRNEFYEETCDLFSSSAKAFPVEMPDATEFGPLRFEGFEMKWRGMKSDERAGRKRQQKRAEYRRMRRMRPSR